MHPNQPQGDIGVLIVDDEPQIIAALTDLLEDNYRVMSETSPRRALEMTRDGLDVSAILCDQRMPKMTGDEFLAAAREHTDATRVLITGFADLEAVIRAVNEGRIYGYLTKPWDPHALIGMVKNAVDHFALNQMMRRERALFGDLMRSISDGVFFKDAEGRYARLNQAEASILNLGAAEEAIGKTAQDFLPSEVAEKWSGEERAAMKAGRGACNVMRDVVAPDGTRKWYAVNMASIRNAHDDVSGLVGISRDVTEEKHIQQIKDEFVSTVSHELRTPLTSIQGSLALLRSGVAGELSKGAGEMIEVGHQNCGRLLRLINDILDLDKLEQGGLRIERAPVSIDGLLEEAAAANENYGLTEGKTIELARPLPSACVSGDRGRLLQVLANLISNALKFSPPNGRIRLRGMVVDDVARISVIDLGGGVPEEFRTRIFKRFSQADSSDARRKGGAGLGLSISRSIIDLHGGRINFKTRMNWGTKFYFDLPLCEGDAASKAASNC